MAVGLIEPLLGLATSKAGQNLIGGIGSLFGLRKANRQLNQSMSAPNEAQLRRMYDRSQGMIDEMSYGNAMSPVMDLATMQGNQGVQDAMMMGMGGSQANAIRNRMQNNAATSLYNAYQQNAAQRFDAQNQIDTNVFNQMNQVNNMNRARMFAQGGDDRNMFGQTAANALQNLSNLTPEQKTGLQTNYRDFLQAGSGLLGALDPRKLFG